jgi:hypothetical protein
MYTVVLQPILMAYFINPSHQSVCLHVHVTTVARQRLSTNVIAAKNKQAREELLFLRGRHRYS